MTDTPCLDWRTHSVGRLLPGRHCGRGALMRDEHGRPCHKACAERALAAPLAPVVPLRRAAAELFDLDAVRRTA